MSDFSTILAIIRSNLMQSGVRYKKSTSDVAGATDGSTIKDSTLTQLDDYWNGCDVVLSTGEVNKVSDFTSGTLTFGVKAWSTKIASGTAFELFEPGTWRGDDLKRFIEQGANEFLRLCPKDLLNNYKVREIIGGVLGALDCPANVLRYVEPILRINGQKVDILAPERASYLEEAAFIDPTSGSYIGYFAGRADADDDVGQFFYKPATNQDGVWHYVPRAQFASDGSWKVPEELWEPVGFMATAVALLANEMFEEGRAWRAKVNSYLPKKAETDR